jgi:hypothetical protein
MSRWLRSRQFSCTTQRWLRCSRGRLFWALPGWYLVAGCLYQTVWNIVTGQGALRRRSEPERCLPPLYDWAVTVPEPAAHWLGGVERWSRAHGWASDALAALAFAAVLGGLSINGSQGLHWSLVWVIVLIAAFAVLHLTVAFRRRWPEFAYAAASVALLVIVLAPDAQVSHPVSGGPARVPALFLPSSLVFLVVLFSVAPARAPPAVAPRW